MSPAIRALCNIIIWLGRSLDTNVADLFRPRCAHCHKPIRRGQLTASALGQAIHRYCGTERRQPEYSYHHHLGISALKGAR